MRNQTEIETQVDAKQKAQQLMRNALKPPEKLNRDIEQGLRYERTSEHHIAEEAAKLDWAHQAKDRIEQASVAEGMLDIASLHAKKPVAKDHHLKYVRLTQGPVPYTENLRPLPNEQVIDKKTGKSTNRISKGKNQPMNKDSITSNTFAEMHKQARQNEQTRDKAKGLLQERQTTATREKIQAAARTSELKAEKAKATAKTVENRNTSVGKSRLSVAKNLDISKHPMDAKIAEKRKEFNTVAKGREKTVGKNSSSSQNAMNAMKTGHKKKVDFGLHL